MATRENTDYLRFSAFAMKDLITRKLAQDSAFTDQIYPGSNIQILIDIVSYMYQTLLYNLNNAAAESLFSDTKIFENINRLCQFIGYNPHGMNPAVAVFSFPTNQSALTANTSEINLTIPRYSYVDTGKTDDIGRKIYFSTVEDISLDGLKDSATKEITLYNGRWKLYDTVFTAEGSDWETFVLNGLRSDSSTNSFVANNYIHVYVSEPVGNGAYGKPVRYNMTDGGLFKSRNEFFNRVTSDESQEIPIPRLYSSNDHVFNLRLDETKTYTISFGNNRQGHRLARGSVVYVFYLDSNGPGVELYPNEVNGASLLQDFSSYRTTVDGRFYDNIYQKILGLEAGSSSEDVIRQYVMEGIEDVSNASSTLGFAPEESVDQIRDFAPNWFRMGNRLVTKRDYEYFLNNSPSFRNFFGDVKCMNNWEYMSTFYKWLYEMGKKYQREINPDDTLGGRRFLKQDNVLKTTRQYADPADSNNIYLWVVPSYNSASEFDDPSFISGQKSNIAAWKQVLLPIKDLTHEPYFIGAIFVRFFLCAAPSNEYVRENYLTDNDSLRRVGVENYIEVTIADEVIYANATIQNQIRTIIYNFFRSENFKIGEYVDFNKLQDQIFAINGVNRIRTIFKPTDEPYPVNVRNGLCFMSYTDDPILQIRNRVEGIDLDISSAGRSLEAFQFPRLGNTMDSINVKIIKHSATSLNTVAY